MKQIIDRIGYSFIGILILVIIEGMSTLGNAFKFEQYSWLGVMIQLMLVFVTIWVANNIYEDDVKNKSKQ